MMRDHIYVVRGVHESSGTPTISLVIGETQTSFIMDVTNAQELAQTILGMVGEIKAEDPHLVPIPRSAN